MERDDPCNACLLIDDPLEINRVERDRHELFEVFVNGKSISEIFERCQYLT